MIPKDAIMNDIKGLNILVVDDATAVQRLLTRQITRQQHRCHCAGTLREAAYLIDEQSFDLIFLDIFLPDGNGIDFIGVCREQPKKPPLIVMITGSDDLTTVEEAMMKGAWDYLQKPFDVERVDQLFDRAQALKNVSEENVTLTTLTSSIIGESQAIQGALQILGQAAPKDVNVLITGDSGTGKELFAHELHRQSHRTDHPFVVVDCAVLPESLIESILFGHIKGAFTGATSDRKGLILQAEKGTLFLDEIGELPLEIQKKFLRVLQERTISPLGGKEIISVDFRLVCATNRNLTEMVEDSTFRLDLYHRISTFPIHLPSIKVRQNDVILLTQFFIEKLCKQHQCPIRECSEPFFAAIKNYDWPGNVRELRNVMEHIILTTSERILYPDHLPSDIRSVILKTMFSKNRKKRIPSSHQSMGSSNIEFSPTIQEDQGLSMDEGIAALLAKGESIPDLKTIRQEAIEQVENRYLKTVLSHTKGNTTEAMALSGIAKSQFYRLLKKYDLS